jgi:hypothetical protein
MREMRAFSGLIAISLLALVFVSGFSGCEKKTGYATVIGKEHIAAAPPTAETPSVQSVPGPTEQFRPIAHDEITVDGYVMKPEMRGTSRDPRAVKAEQWLVKVRMVENARIIQVHADQAQWQKLRENDRVKVTYRMGKYTGTVWDAAIE